MMRWIPLPALLSALLLPAALLPASSARADEPPAPDASPAPRHDRGEAEQLRLEVEKLAQRMAELQERLRELGGRTTAMPRFELDAAEQEALERAAQRPDAAREVLRSLIVSGPARGDLARLGPQVEQAVREALASLGLQDVTWTHGALVLKDGVRLSASDMRAKLDRLRATLTDRLRALLPEADLRVELQGQPLIAVEGGFAERAYVAPDVAPSREGDETAAQHVLDDALRQLQEKGLPPAQLEAARAQLEAALQAHRVVPPARSPSDPTLPDLRRPPAELHVRLPDSRVEAKLLGPDGQALPGALVAPRAALPVPAGPAPAGAEMAEALKGLSEAVRALREDVRALRESLVRPDAPASGPR